MKENLTMKRTLSSLLILALCLSLASAAVAEAPAAGSLKLEQQTVRGNSSWTPESYPEIWITPVFAEYIIDGRDAERYPANFLRFAPPEGAAPLRIDSDYANLIDFDTLLQYSYQAHDRASFELFLERVEEQEYILADGSDGVAIYVSPDRRGRARAMLSISEHFGGTSKLRIEIYDNAGDNLSAEALGELIQAEVARVQAAMQFVELDRYWAEGVFAAVELFNGQVTIAIDTADMTLTDIQDRRIRNRVLVDGKVRTTEIEINSPFQDDLVDAQLADGTEYIYKVSEFWGNAYFYIQEGRTSGQIYLHIRIEGTFTPEEFAAEVEKVYALVTLP